MVKGSVPEVRPQLSELQDLERDLEAALQMVRAAIAFIRQIPVETATA